MISKCSAPEPHLQLWILFRSLGTKGISICRIELACWIKMSSSGGTVTWKLIAALCPTPWVTLQPVPRSDSWGKDWLMVTRRSEKRQFARIHDGQYRMGFPESLTVRAWAKTVRGHSCNGSSLQIYMHASLDSGHSSGFCRTLIRVLPDPQGSCASCAWVMK